MSKICIEINFNQKTNKIFFISDVSESWQSFSPSRNLIPSQATNNESNTFNNNDEIVAAHSLSNPNGTNPTGNDNNIELFNSMANSPSTNNAVQLDNLSGHLSLIDISDTNETDSNAMLSDYDSIPNIENKDCEYLKLLIGFKRTLVLPDVFFSYDIPVCYCTLCGSNNGKNLLKGKQKQQQKCFKLNSFK